ncbi:MAG: hypothetical protein ACP5O1_06090 [Phycisphaerae bacterium]
MAYWLSAVGTQASPMGEVWHKATLTFALLGKVRDAVLELLLERRDEEFHPRQVGRCGFGEDCATRADASALFLFLGG